MSLFSWLPNTVVKIVHRLIDLFQDALKQCVGSIDTEYSKKHDEFFIGFEGR